MRHLSIRRRLVAGLVLGCAVLSPAAEETVATAVYARTGNGYKREKLKDDSFKPEYYALANGGRIAGTIGDKTVERVTYPEVADIAAKLLAGQNYHYAQNRDQAKLLLMLQWGNTIGFERSDHDKSLGIAAGAYGNLAAALGAMGLGMKDAGMVRGAGDVSINPVPGQEEAADARTSAAQDAMERYEMAMMRLFADTRVRDQINEHNAKILGYTDDLADTNDIRRWAGGGDRFNDMVADIEETRYYIVVTAYDFEELTKHNKRKVLWVTKVSVRSPGNRFDDSIAAMMKSASKYFGQNSGRLIRGEETKGTVELGDLKFLGEAKEVKPPKAEQTKAKRK